MTKKTKAEAVAFNRETIRAFIDELAAACNGREKEFVDILEEVLRAKGAGLNVLFELKKRAERDAFGDATPPKVNGALGFVDRLEKRLGNCLEYAGNGLDYVHEEWDELLGELAGAWQDVRYIRRELDPKAWGTYKVNADDGGPTENIDTSDNDAQGSEAVS